MPGGFTRFHARFVLSVICSPGVCSSVNLIATNVFYKANSQNRYTSYVFLEGPPSNPHGNSDASYADGLELIIDDAVCRHMMRKCKSAQRCGFQLYLR